MKKARTRSITVFKSSAAYLRIIYVRFLSRITLNSSEMTEIGMIIAFPLSIDMYGEQNKRYPTNFCREFFDKNLAYNNITYVVSALAGGLEIC